MNKEIVKRLKDSLDYDFDLSFSDRKQLLSYIEQLEKKVDQYENPDDLTLFYMWLDTNAKDKMKQLKKELKEEQEDNYKQSELLVKKQKKIEQLETDYKEAIESVTWWQNRFNAIKRDNKNLKNNRDKAIEFINSEEFNTLTINKRKKLNDILKGDSE